MRAVHRLTSALAGVSIGLAPVPALAQQCITEGEAGAIIRYSMPALAQSASVQCAGQGTYFTTGASALAARYAAQRPAVWPQAKSALSKFAGQGPEELQIMKDLPDEALRPFVDALLVEVISQKVPMQDCGKVEKLMRALEPLEPAELGTLFGAIASVVEFADPAICED